MLDTVLLVVTNCNLRQLYHELLFSPTTEIVPSSDISDALLLLALQPYSAAVIYIDDTNETEVSAFLKLRKKQLSLLQTKMILLSSEAALFGEFLTRIDRVIDVDKVSPGKIASVISACLH